MKRAWFYLFQILILVACHAKTDAPAAEDAAPEDVQTPVSVTEVQTVPLEQFVELNATSSYLQSNVIKANANGYIKAVNLKLGQTIGSGAPAFIIQTKEAAALGNTINKLDPSFHFSGLLHIKTTTGGYVQELNHHVGDYVQDGDQLAVVSDARSYGFVLNLPYELRRYVQPNSNLDVALPDSTHLKGTVASFLPALDSASQTQGVLIRVPVQVPQNLIAKVRIQKLQKAGAPSVPKAAVLSDEAQTSFWVMKLLDSATAVKVPVIKGVEAGDRVELLKPPFAAGDKVLLSGNYGLPDTAHVKIVTATE